METAGDQFLSTINEMFTEKIPFNKLLGLRIGSMDHERVQAVGTGSYTVG